MKFIVFSDLHIHNYTRFDVDGSRLDNCLKVLDDIFEAASKSNIDTILFCGDLYDQQKAIPTIVINKTIKKFIQLFKKYPNIYFYAISGNHDHSTKNTIECEAISSITHLEDICNMNFQILDNTYIILNDFMIYGIPYYTHKEHFSEHVKKSWDSITIENPKKTYYLIHQTPPNSNPLIPCDFQPEIFAHSAYTFCGHIHKREQISPNLVLVGSPLHRDLGDEGLEKGYLIFDTDVDNYDFIPLNYPMFSVDNETNPKVVIDLYNSEVEDSDFDLSLPKRDLLELYTEAVDIPKFWKNIIHTL